MKLNLITAAFLINMACYSYIAHASVSDPDRLFETAAAQKLIDGTLHLSAGFAQLGRTHQLVNADLAHGTAAERQQKTEHRKQRYGLFEN